MVRTVSQPRLSEIARHCILPDGIVASDFPRVEKLANALGIRYDMWQRGLGTALLGKRESGLYACGVGGASASIPRQTGKTFTIGTIIVMLCILKPRLKVLWTAHRTRTSAETFRNMQGIVGQRMVSRYVKAVRRANGQEEIEFTDGSRILFGAREQGFGRGFDGIDIEVFDEAQILTQKALEDMLPAMSVAVNPLVIYIGTPPRPSDPGDVFSQIRDNALDGVDRDTLYVEFSADRGCELDNRDQWKKANPSYPHRTSETALLRLRRQLSDDSFRREVLGVWDVTATQSAVPVSLWDKATVQARRDGGVSSFAVDITPDLSKVSVGACMKYDDGSCHVELAVYEPLASKGLDFFADWLASRWEHTAAVCLDSRGPAASLGGLLQERHVKVTFLQTRDVGQSTARFMTLLTEGKLTHLDESKQPVLYQAVRGATKRPLGRDGLFAWNKMGSDVDISPLVAVSMAIQAAYTTKRHPGRKARVMR